MCLQVDPTNNDVMNDVLSKKKSMDSLNIHIEIRDKEEGVILCQQALCHRGGGRYKNLEGTLGNIQVLRHQRGGWVGSENGNF